MSQLIMHIVGNRPQFIKLASVSREIRRRGYSEIIIHTGQHFDENMSDIFFAELDIPKPDKNLHISGGSHGEMTARIMLALEPQVRKYNPRVAIVYGDTNSTLAAAIVVRKLNIPVIHIEAGLRTRLHQNPEEINRVLVDHASDLLCAPDIEAKNNLDAENLGENSYFTGDVMYDTFLYCQNRGDVEKIFSTYKVHKKGYILMTWHRQENTSDIDRMSQILDLIEHIDRPVICPLHPRTYVKLEENGLLERAIGIEMFKMVKPVRYLEMMTLASNCGMILTDSGGLSKESFFAGVKCMFMLDAKVWPDLERIGWITHMCKDNQKNREIIEQCFEGTIEASRRDNVLFYGDGHAAKKIVDLIEKLIGKDGE